MLAGEQFLSHAQHERALVHAPNDHEVLGPNPIERLRCRFAASGWSVISTRFYSRGGWRLTRYHPFPSAYHRKWAKRRHDLAAGSQNAVRQRGVDVVTRWPPRTVSHCQLGWPCPDPAV